MTSILLGGTRIALRRSLGRCRRDGTTAYGDCVTRKLRGGAAQVPLDFVEPANFATMVEIRRLEARMRRTTMLHRITTQDARLTVEEIGDGDIGLLLVHGLGSNRYCWKRAREHLDLARYRLLVPDLPGFGASEVSSDFDFSIRAQASCLSAVVERWGFAEWHVVGHSMGGAVALALCSEPGRAPRSVVLAEGNLEANDTFMSGKVARRSEASFVRAYSKWVESFRESLNCEANEQHRLYVESLLETSPVAFYRAAVACYESSCSGQLPLLLAGLSCPVAYVIGEKTRRVRGLPGPIRTGDVPYIEVPQQDHFMMESAGFFYAWLNRWLAAVRSRDASWSPQCQG